MEGPSSSLILVKKLFLNQVTDAFKLLYHMLDESGEKEE